MHAIVSEHYQSPFLKMLFEEKHSFRAETDWPERFGTATDCTWNKFFSPIIPIE